MIKGFESKISLEELNERHKRVSILIEKGIMEKIDGTFKISGKFAANFYMEEGFPKEMLKDMVNSFIKTGKFNTISQRL